MITDFLLAHPTLTRVTALLLPIVCISVGVLLLRSRRGRSRLAMALALLSVLPVLVLTLVPTGGNRRGSVGCTVQFAAPTLSRVELLANVALFVVPVFFAVLATRRPLLVLAAGVSLSGAIEALQAVVPAVGRACDTNDWAMNSLGTVVGALLAWGTITLARTTSASAL